MKVAELPQDDPTVMYRVRAIRLMRGLTPSEVAAAVDISRSSMSKLERGFIESRRSAVRLAVYYGVPFRTLFQHVRLKTIRRYGMQRRLR